MKPRQIQLFICAVQFLTRLPTPRLAGFEPDWTARSARYFPLVGQLVGAISAAAYLGAALVWPPWIAALLAVAAGVVVTGGFHEDGLADAVDGLGGGHDRARRLAIMKDSRIGTYGVLALGLTVALKVAALASLPPGVAPLALVAGHGAARAAAVAAMRAQPYAGDPDAAKWLPAPAGPTPADLALALLFAAWPLLLLAPVAASLSLVLGAVLALALALAARRLVGGQTGDILGGVEQLFETGFLLGLAVRVVQP
jgi:adenosylcobinamide-GDP ribazoletransferase